MPAISRLPTPDCRLPMQSRAGKVKSVRQLFMAKQAQILAGAAEGPRVPAGAGGALESLLSAREEPCGSHAPPRPSEDAACYANTSGFDGRLRRFGGRGWNGGAGLMARPRRLKCHAPVQRAVGTTRQLRRAAEVEIRVARLADRPAAVVPLEVEECLRLVGSLCFLAHVHPASARPPVVAKSPTDCQMGSPGPLGIPAFGGRLSPAGA